MKVAVCVKQIPDPADPGAIDPETKTLNRDVKLILDESDSYGVEMALQLVGDDGEVVLISMVPNNERNGLNNALAMGADSAILVSDDALSGSDALSTAKVLAAAIQRTEPDLVLAATESSDGYTGTVPEQVAELLGLPSVTFAKEVTVDSGNVAVKRQTEDGYDEVDCPLPALVSVTAGVVEPRYPSFKGIMAAKSGVNTKKEQKPKPKPTTKKPTTEAKDKNEIALSQIKTNQYQPRLSFDEKKLQELAESIKKHGVVQPILVREADKGYELIAGERRMRASKLAGLKKIPAVIAKVSNTQSLEIAILENVQREDLNPLEVSKGYQRLKNEFGYTQEQVAKSVGKPRSSIANSLRLLSLSPKAQTELEKGTISEGHAKVLLGTDPAKAEALLERILAEKLSVRDLEKLSQPTKTTYNKTQKTRDELNLESALSSKLGSKVTIEDQKGKGKMVIKYYSYDELDGIIEKFSN